MNIRTATIKDLEAVTSVEAECFPPAEAATREELAERLKYYADHFWLMTSSRIRSLYQATELSYMLLM